VSFAPYPDRRTDKVRSRLGAPQSLTGGRLWCLDDITQWLLWATSLYVRSWPIAEAAERLFFELREQLRQLVACLAHRMSYR